MSQWMYIDPFSSETLTTIPPFLLQSDTAWDGFQFANSLESDLLRLNEPEAKILPDLQSDVLSLDLEGVALPDLSALSVSADSSDNEFFEVQEQPSGEDEEVADLWVLPDVSKRRPTNQLIGWDNFLDDRHREPPTGYLSEAEPRIFSTILRGTSSTTPSKIVKDGVLLDALFEVTMGRSSSLFEWNQEKERFMTRWEDISAIGYSAIILRNTFETFSTVGTETRQLINLSRVLDKESHKILPAHVALISSARSALFAVHRYLENMRLQVFSLLQLNGLISKVKTIVHILKTCCDATQTRGSDKDIISRVVREASNASIAHPALDEILQEVFTRITRPVLAKLSDEIGLSSDLTCGQTSEFLEVEDESGRSWHSLLSPESSLLIAQTKRGLKLLLEYAQDSPLCRGRGNKALPGLSLDPAYTYDAICKHQNSASCYETVTKDLILSPVNHLASDSDDGPSIQHHREKSAISLLDHNSQFHLDPDLFASKIPQNEQAQHDTLGKRIEAYLTLPHSENRTTLQLDLQEALTCSTSPIIIAQHRLVSYSVLQLLFQKHDLISHIRLQRSFYLFSNATFSQRLNIALFDSNQTSGEGRRQIGGSTGLRLQARDTWPPASSELRLVLMGILSDSLTTARDRTLDDSISFAIRDMPLKDLEKCRDVDSIHALDFLRLQYKPSNRILESVLSPGVLDKYDRIFQHLLRILRLHSVTQRLLRDNLATRKAPLREPADQKLILHMHHFISAVADYYQNTAITLCWIKFDSMLNDVKTHIDNKDYERTLQTVKSQDYLRSLHEQTLDNVLHAMLLAKRQSPGLMVLYDILNLILQFAASRRNKNAKADIEKGANVDDPLIRRFDDEFKAKVTAFIEILRVPEKDRAQPAHPRGKDITKIGQYDGDDHQQDDLFHHLLLKLDMFGYWSPGGQRRDLYFNHER